MKSELLKDQAFRDLVKTFRKMGDESQQNVIRRVSDRDEKELAEYLRKIRRMQKRSERMEELTDEILSKIE